MLWAIKNHQDISVTISPECLLVILAHSIAELGTQPGTYVEWIPVVIAPRAGTWYPSPQHMCGVLIKGLLLIGLFFRVSSEFGAGSMMQASVVCGELPVFWSPQQRDYLRSPVSSGLLSLPCVTLRSWCRTCSMCLPCFSFLTSSDHQLVSSTQGAHWKVSVAFCGFSGTFLLPPT